jgi:hypothetical protein
LGRTFKSRDSPQRGACASFADLAPEPVMPRSYPGAAGDVLFVQPCYRYEGEGFYVLRNAHRDPKLGGDTVCRVGHGPRLLFDNRACAASLNRMIDRREFDDSVIGRVAWAANRL